MKISVLFADDQIPFKEPNRNDEVKEEICKEFAEHRGKDPKSTAEGFEDDRDYFEKLITYLISEKGVNLIRVRSYKEALKKIKKYDPKKAKEEDKIDVAIIDLSWWGDKKLPSGPEGRDNIGYKLLECAQSKFEKHDIFIPTIAYSQNFYKRPGIMGEVLKRNALPIPKINRKDDDAKKRQMGYQALFSAIEHLKDLHPINDISKKRVTTFERNFQRKSRNFEYLLFGALGLLVVALLVPVFAAVDDALVRLIIQALIGGTGASLLGWGWRDQRMSRQDLSEISRDLGMTKG